MEQFNFWCVVSSRKFRAIKMRILQFTQKHMALYGITAAQSIRKRSLDLRILLEFFIFALVFLLNFVYLLQVSNSKECAASVYANSLAVFVLISFANLIWKMEETFQFISAFEEAIDKSMWKMFYFRIRGQRFRLIQTVNKLFQG